MTRVLLALVALASLAACNPKPSEEACEQAIANVRKLTGLDKADVGADPKAAVRSCQAQSSKKSVQCMIAAQSLEDIEECEGEEGQRYYEEAEEKAEAAREAEEAAPEAAEAEEAAPEAAEPEEAAPEAAEPEADAEESDAP